MSDPDTAEPRPTNVNLDFCLRGTSLDVARVTAALGLTPSEAHEAGQAYVGRDGTPRVRPAGVWHLRSTPAVASERLDDHAAYLLDVLEPRAKAIEGVRRIADYSCVWVWYETD